MKHFLHTITFSIIISTSVHAQLFQWTFSNPGQLGNGIIADNSGNTYVIASGIGGSYGPFTFTSSSQTVAKHDTAGNVVWVTWVKGANCTSISRDRLNNIYVAGSCGNAVFASTSNTINVTQQGYGDAFLAKYDPNGNVIWVKTSGTSYSGDGFSVLKTDPFGNSYVCGGEGYFNGNLGYAVSNFVISKYDSQGNLTWTKNSNWNGSAVPRGIDLDQQGNCYLTGGFSDSAYFDNNVFYTNTYGSIFLVKYSPLGNVLWAQKIGTGYDESFDLSFDKKNGVYITGIHSASSNFGGTSLSPKGMFIAKYDTSGSIIWVEHANAKGGISLASDSLGCYVAGWFNSSVTFSTGNNIITLQTNKVNHDLFVAKFDTAGNIKWAISPGGTVADQNSATSIAIDNSGLIFITGSFNGVTTFGNTTLTQPDGIFVTRIKDNPFPIITALQETIKHKSGISVYPSPTNGLFNMVCQDLKDCNVQVRVINNLGETLYSEEQKHKGGQYLKVFDLSSLPKGIYFVEVKTNEDRYIKKVVLE